MMAASRTSRARLLALVVASLGCASAMRGPRPASPDSDGAQGWLALLDGKSDAAAASFAHALAANPLDARALFGAANLAFEHGDPSAALNYALTLLEGASQDGATISLDDLRGRIAASISCHAAIKVNMALDRSKMDWLLQALGGTDCPMTCPHGRPTVLRYGMKDLMKAFKRI